MELSQIKEQIERAKAEYDHSIEAVPYSPEHLSARKRCALEVRAAVEGIIREFVKHGWPVDADASFALVRGIKDDDAHWVIPHNMLTDFTQTKFGEQGSRAHVIAELKHHGYPIVLDIRHGPVDISCIFDRG